MGVSFYGLVVELEGFSFSKGFYEQSIERARRGRL